MKMFLGVLLIAGAAVGFVQQRRIGNVRDAIEMRRESLAEAKQLRSDIAQSKSNAVSAAQIAAMRAGRAELMRLRSSLPELRISAQSPEQIEAEIQRLNKSAEQEEKNAHLIHETFEASKEAKVIHGTLDSISVILQQIQGGKGATVRSFGAVENALQSGELKTGFGALWENLEKGWPPYNITKQHFEFLPENASRDGIFLVRERQPRQLPDGTWARFYLTSDFQVNELKLADGNYEAWERQHR